jgi:hypothetical protein
MLSTEIRNIIEVGGTLLGSKRDLSGQEKVYRDSRKEY